MSAAVPTIPPFEDDSWRPSRDFFGGPPPVDPADPTGTRAVRDAGTLLGVRFGADRVRGAARVRWHGPDTTAAGLAEGVVGIGEATTGRGLSGIVASARAAAERILDDADL